MSEEDITDSERLKQDMVRLSELKNTELRIFVESFYDMQKLRIAIESRIRSYTTAGLIEYIDPSMNHKSIYKLVSTL